VNRSPFVLPQVYISTLEAVLGLDLTSKHAGRSKDRNWKELVAGVAELSKGLTIDRVQTQSGVYLSTPIARRAYMLYYMTTNLFKLWPAFRELSLAGFFEQGNRPLTHLDLGGGPGTAVWSFVLWLELEGPKQEGLQQESFNFILTDLLRSNLEDARQFQIELAKRIPEAKGLFESLDLSDLTALKAFGARHGKFKLLTMMNALNELDEAKDEELIRILFELLEDEGALIIIEPSSREISRRALRFRDRVIAAGGSIFAPCTHNNNCPALTKEGDWCHTEIQWERPLFINAIDDEIGTLRLSLKDTYSTIRKRAGNIRDSFPSEAEVSARIVSELFDEKGRYRAFFCSDRGREEFILNKREESPSNRQFGETRRYDLVQIESFEPRPHDVKLAPGSTVNIVLTSSGARIVDK